MRCYKYRRVVREAMPRRYVREHSSRGANRASGRRKRRGRNELALGEKKVGGITEKDPRMMAAMPGLALKRGHPPLSKACRHEVTVRM
jgi:hypothetical protein